MSGEQVVVKVQRPLLEELVQTDLEIFQTLVSQIEEKFEWGKKYSLQKLFEEFSRTIKEELDFLNEGQNVEQIGKGNKGSKGSGEILVPKRLEKLYFMK